MIGKIEITGKIKVLTGLHIGGSESFSAIGATDSPVVRDAFSGEPMIPGSSLKGKIRTLLAQIHNDKEKNPTNAIEDDAPEIKRLFGYSAADKAQGSRLIFSDMVAENIDELRKIGIYSPTEVKYENSINRLNGIANPRQIERVIKGVVFPLKIIYNAETEEETLEDFRLLKEGIDLLRYDYLGGHGSRGYGRIEIDQLEAEACIGNIEESLINSCNQILKEEVV